MTRLQVSVGGHGLDLTAATLSALMKYTVPASHAGTLAPAERPSNKKPGYFASETETVEWIRSWTGLNEGDRHPLTWLMEACDDIAYSILDIEDAIKKAIISPEDVLAHLKRRLPRHEAFVALSEKIDADFSIAHQKPNLTRIAEIKTSYLRTRLIEKFVTATADEFLVNRDLIFEQKFNRPLLESGTAASIICAELKQFARARAYLRPSRTGRWPVSTSLAGG